MTKPTVSRYNNIAISLHWLMALLIVGMLIVGKFMVQLDETSNLRFALTQWHKTFGILILLLAVLRVLWRLTHRSPAHPESAPAWEHFAANVSHIALYALLFIAPITGWMLVSVSPLNIDTFLFNVVPWPHLPWLTDIIDKESTEARYAQFHEWATGGLIALLLLHIVAALKHHFIDKDTVMARMLPTKAARTGRTMMGVLLALVAGCFATVLGYTAMNPSANQLQAGNSAVSAIASVMGAETTISFADSTVTATLNPDAADTSTLLANVNTASVSSDNLQVQGALPDTEWFNSAEFPSATFESTRMESGDNGFNVIGTLTIKGIAVEQRFELTLSEKDGQKMASGQFEVDRTEYQLGMESQPNGDYVANEVTIAFEFTLNQ